jgi:hypothetical protein
MKKFFVIIASLIFVAICLFVTIGRIRTLLVRHRLSSVLAERDRNAPADYGVWGEDGTLFYSEEIRYCLLNWYKNRNNEKVVAFSQELAREGITLLVVPVPTKVEVYPELLTGIDGEVRGSRAHVIDYLRKNGVTTIDLLPEFRKSKGGEPLYPKTETHWGQRGIAIAADAVVGKLPRDKFRPAGRNRWIAKDTIITNYQGDLAAKQHKIGNVDETIRLSMVMQSDTGKYRDSDTASILVIGDSFAGMYGKELSANISAQIALRLNRPVALFWALNGFYRAPAELRRLRTGGAGKIATVVWIFTSRALMESSLEFPGDVPNPSSSLVR